MVRSGSERTVSMKIAASQLMTGSLERRANARPTAIGMPSTTTEAKMNTVSDSPPHCSVVTTCRPKTPPYISRTNVPNPVSQTVARRLRPQSAGTQDRTIVATIARQARVERQCSSNG